MNDPYAGFRDGRGRFTEGNPGRTSYVWLDGVEFKTKYPFLNVVVPGGCPQCGGAIYRFDFRLDGKNMYIVRCKCNTCNHPRTYNFSSKTWSNI